MALFTITSPETTTTVLSIWMLFFARRTALADAGRELCLLRVNERRAGQCRQEKQDTMVHRVILI